MPNIPLDLPHKGPVQNGPSQHLKNSDTARLSSATNKAKIDVQRLPSMDDSEHGDQKGQDIPQNVDDCQNITAMSRLLDKTNSQMEALETKIQRNMMAQLRSAFAMILADQKNPGVVLRAPAPKKAETANDQTMDAQTPMTASSHAILRLPPELRVESQAPSTAHATAPTAQPSDQTAQQTIKIPTDKKIDAAPSETVTEVTTDISFAEFALKMDVRTINDLLEIAVVYLSVMKGQAYFSGPDIMQLLRKQLAERFDKDTSWKCFHAMRRDGKIEKLGPAKFRIAAKIGYDIEEEALP
jgi:hypothetical protein